MDIFYWSHSVEISDFICFLHSKFWATVVTVKSCNFQTVSILSRLSSNILHKLYIMSKGIIQNIFQDFGIEFHFLMDDSLVFFRIVLVISWGRWLVRLFMLGRAFLWCLRLFNLASKPKATPKNTSKIHYCILLRKSFQLIRRLREQIKYLLI